MSDDSGRRRKVRTRSHIIADISENFLERKVLANGYLLRRPARDYGIDVTMFHFDSAGRIENGEVRFQLKATDNLKYDSRRVSIPIRIDTRDVDHWNDEVSPVILVVFDAPNERAFWLDFHEYVESNPKVIKTETKSVRLHVPLANELTIESIEAFRQKSLQTLNLASRRKDGADGQRKKPR
jgi:hypothetical protein